MNIVSAHVRSQSLDSSRQHNTVVSQTLRPPPRAFQGSFVVPDDEVVDILEELLTRTRCVLAEDGHHVSWNLKTQFCCYLYY